MISSFRATTRNPGEDTCSDQMEEFVDLDTRIKSEYDGDDCFVILGRSKAKTRGSISELYQ